MALDWLEVTLLPSEHAPRVSFSEEQWARLRTLRRAFLRSHGVIPRDDPDAEGD